MAMSEGNEIVSAWGASGAKINKDQRTKKIKIIREREE